MSSSFGSDVYSGAASFGRFTAIISAVVLSLLAVALIALGIDLIYNKHIPEQIPTDNKTPMSNKQKGWILIAISIVLLVMSWGWVWVTEKYKFAAAVGGVGSAVNVFKSVI